MRHLDAGVQPIAAPEPELVDPPSCARPYVNASTRVATPPKMPAGYAFNGEVGLMLALRNDGSVAAIRVDKSSTIPEVNRAAAVAAGLSVFNAPVYRCAPVSGNSIFLVEFRSQ